MGPYDMAGYEALRAWATRSLQMSSMLLEQIPNILLLGDVMHARVDRHYVPP